MRKLSIAAISLFTLCGARELTREELEKATEADFVQITGVYFYNHGDNFVYECGGALCADKLARDDFLQKNASKLDGKTITIIIRRKVCLNKELTPHCVWSDGTYLHIKKWVDPKP